MGLNDLKFRDFARVGLGGMGTYLDYRQMEKKRKLAEQLMEQKRLADEQTAEVAAEQLRYDREQDSITNLDKYRDNYRDKFPAGQGTPETLGAEYVDQMNMMKINKKMQGPVLDQWKKDRGWDELQGALKDHEAEEATPIAEQARRVMSGGMPKKEVRFDESVLYENKDTYKTERLLPEAYAAVEGLYLKVVEEIGDDIDTAEDYATFSKAALVILNRMDITDPEDQAKVMQRYDKIHERAHSEDIKERTAAVAERNSITLQKAENRRASESLLKHSRTFFPGAYSPSGEWELDMNKITTEQKGLLFRVEKYVATANALAKPYESILAGSYGILSQASGGTAIDQLPQGQVMPDEFRENVLALGRNPDDTKQVMYSDFMPNGDEVPNIIFTDEAHQRHVPYDLDQLKKSVQDHKEIKAKMRERMWREFDADPYAPEQPATPGQPPAPTASPIPAQDAGSASPTTDHSFDLGRAADRIEHGFGDLALAGLGAIGSIPGGIASIGDLIFQSDDGDPVDPQEKARGAADKAPMYAGSDITSFHDVRQRAVGLPGLFGNTILNKYPGLK